MWKTWSINLIVMVILLRHIMGVYSKILSESDRANRAAFIQKLLNKDKKLEGRLRLVGGPDEFEGKQLILFLNHF